MTQFKIEIKQELNQLLNWWETNMTDTQNGGFYGRRDGRNRLYPRAEKGVILNTRILWTFAAAANQFPAKGFQQTAKRAYEYISEHFFDKQHSGLFWMLDYQGIPVQTKKQIYAQAFGIYALSEYYLLTGEETAINQTLELFALIENHSKDKQNGGYFEAFSRDWELLDDLRLSDKDANEAKTMNTHLHILEAYTTLYKAYPQPSIYEALEELIHCFLERFIDPATHHLHLFFDENWKLKSEEISFGHDIEASWLLVKAAEVLGDAAVLEKIKIVALKIADATLLKGVAKDGRIYNEFKPNTPMDKTCHWWQPAESIVGLLNAYQVSEEEKYLETALLHWEFIKDNLIDKVHGEWFWLVDESGSVSSIEDKAGAWKAPYHNGRMCMEVLRRVESAVLQSIVLQS